MIRLDITHHTDLLGKAIIRLACISTALLGVSMGVANAASILAESSMTITGKYNVTQTNSSGDATSIQLINAIGGGSAGDLSTFLFGIPGNLPII